MGTKLFISHQLSLDVAVKHERVVDYPPLKLKYLLEPVYYKWQKSTLLITDLWNRGPLKVLNSTKMILDDQGNHLDSFRISLESFRYFKDPLFHEPVNGQVLFLPKNRL